MRELLNAHFVLTMCFGSMVFFMIVGLFFLTIPDDNANLVNTALGFVAGWVSSAVGFYFGTTKDNHPDNNTNTTDKELENER